MNGAQPLVNLPQSLCFFLVLNLPACQVCTSDLTAGQGDRFSIGKIKHETLCTESHCKSRLIHENIIYA